MKRVLFDAVYVAWAVAVVGTTVARAAEPQAWDVQPDTWVGTDALGRSIPPPSVSGPPRVDRQVGTFYFLWLPGSNVADASGHPASGPYDVTKILKQDPDALHKPNSKLWGGLYSFHYWGEPLWGYYNMLDPFILRKHAQMLNNAGVDMLLFDLSNSYNYEPVIKQMAVVYHDMIVHGEKVPKIAFHLVAKLADRQIKQIQTVYNEFYKDPQYDDLWFQWEGKPLIVATPDPREGADLVKHFTFRKTFWGGMNKGPGTWDTDGYYPSGDPKHIMRDASGKIEELGAAVASSIIHSPVSTMGPGSGRSWHYDVKTGYRETYPNAVAYGTQFQDNWDFCLQNDPRFVLTYSWNEWVAQRFVGKPQGGPANAAPNTVYFVDQFTEEFSKDIEPMRGGFGDDYYYQLVENVRRYKGARSLPPVTNKTIAIDADHFSDWSDVGPEYRDYIGDPVHRDFIGWNSSIHYRNDTGRNDLVAAKVCYDDRNVYFYVRTDKPITPHTDLNWMELFIDADHNPQTGWLGYDFVVNHVSPDDHTAVIERYSGSGYRWGNPTRIPYVVKDSQLMLSIPRDVLGVKSIPTTLDFKWADNLQQTGDWTDFYENGDTAPDDRFNYRASLAK